MKKLSSVYTIHTCEEEKSLRKKVDIAFRAGLISILITLMSVTLITIIEFEEALAPTITKFGIAEIISNFSYLSKALLIISGISLIVNFGCFFYIQHIYKKNH